MSEPPALGWKEEVVALSHVSLKADGHQQEGELLLTNRRIAFTCPSNSESSFIWSLTQTSDVAREAKSRAAVTFRSPIGVVQLTFKDAQPSFADDFVAAMRFAQREAVILNWLKPLLILGLVALICLYLYGKRP